MKSCIKCNTPKPDTDEFFERTYKGRLRNVCKTCRNKDQKRRYESNHDAALEKQRKYVAANRERILANKKQYRQNNKDKIAEYMSTYRAENKDRIKTEQAEWYQENAEGRRTYSRYYHHNNKERMNFRSRTWHANNPVSSKVLSSNYRTRKLGATGTHTPEDVKYIRAVQNNKCGYCGVTLNKKSKPHLDHFIPLSKGGSNSPDNLVWACCTCNSSKHNRLPIEWNKWNGMVPVLSGTEFYDYD
jgi:5-methylcytosine-specific restriction endonuclease McrA